MIASMSSKNKFSNMFWHLVVLYLILHASARERWSTERDCQPHGKATKFCVQFKIETENRMRCSFMHGLLFFRQYAKVPENVKSALFKRFDECRVSVCHHFIFL